MDSIQSCRLLTLEDVEPAAQVIAQAFVDDPLSAFILPNRKTRLQTLQTLFRALGAVSIQNGRCYGVGEPLQGVAYWKLPDQGGVSASLGSLGKFLPLLLTPYPLGLFRGRAILDRIDRMHETYANGPHFYLDNIGVLPAAQGQGLSSRLIRPFLARADAQNVMAYTETVTASNVPLYEHFGFECVEAAAIAGTGITVYALRRPAHPPG